MSGVVASAILNVSVVVLVAISTLFVLAAPWIARLYALRLEGAAQVQQQEALTFLLRLLIPQIVFYGLTALTAGLLNAHKRFGAPMYTPILNNLAVIAVFIAFHQAYPSISGLQGVSTRQLFIIGFGTTAGVALMALAQLPFLRGLGRYQFTLSLKHPSIRKLARLSTFVIGYVIANQIGYLIVQWLANAQRGGYSAYVWAFTFFMLPHGLFAVSIITALLPDMSSHASNQRWDELRERLSVGVRTTFFLIFPAAVGYFVLGEPIVRILLEHGVMTARSTELVAGVLQFFVIGLLPFSLFQLFLRAFYALQDTKTPFMINCGCVVLNTAVNIPMFAWLGVRGLAAGHALAYIFGVLIQGRALSRRIGGLDAKRIVKSAALIAAGSVVMGLIVWGLSAGVEQVVPVDVLIGQAAAVLVPVAGGVIAYVALCRLLGIEEFDYVRGLISRRASR